MKRKIVVQDVTYKIFGTITDILLWYTFLVGSSFGKRGTRGIYQAMRQADKTLLEINHQTISTAWHNLVKNGLIVHKKRKNLYHAQITAFGKSFLSKKIPTYHQHRPWDGKLYLVVYDIPEKNHRKRDLLRLFLKKIKCKRFQESVWITPYNPRQLINRFIQEKEIQGAIVVSDIGKDGGIGETTLPDFLNNLYELNKLNQRYLKFIEHALEENVLFQNIYFEYLSILKDDPQLPFELLPKSWQGDKAYHFAEKIKEKYTLSIRGRESGEYKKLNLNKN